MIPALWSLLLCFAATTAFGAEDDYEDEPEGERDLQILGWVENAYFVAPQWEIRAKLDTGARTSSLDARVIKRFRQWGRRWVRFAVRHPDTGEEVIMVRERMRTIGIVQHEGDNDVRPTVKIEVCIGGELLDVEVSLADRTNFNYSLLMGRRALRSIAVIDSGETYLSDATCPDNMPERDIVLDPSLEDPDARPVRVYEPDEPEPEPGAEPGPEAGQGAPPGSEDDSQTGAASEPDDTEVGDDETGDETGAEQGDG